MKNLMTRRIVLGLLMVLVLAFSVQGIADALTLHYASNSGDLRTVAPNEEFTIRVSVRGLIDNTSKPVNLRTVKGNTTDIEYAAGTRIRPNVSVSRTVDSGYTTGDTHYYTTSAVDTTTVSGLAITTNTRNWGISGTNDDELPAGLGWATGRSIDIQYAAGTRTRPNVSVSRTIDSGYTTGDTHYYTTSAVATDTVSGLAITTNTRNWLTEDEAYYYNQESVSITSDITLEQGDTAVESLIERHEESDRRLSSSIILTGSHGAAGAFDITITDTTDATDIDGTPPSPRASIVYTIFVVDRDPAADEADWGFTGLTSTVERYKVGGDDFTDDAITTASAGEFNRVEYSVTEGSGRLYVQRTPTRKTSSNRTITTSAAAVVHLDMNGTTNKVRAEISGVAPVTATFIFGHPEVTIVSGNNQEGSFGGQLDDPLVVKVTDGSRSRRPIAGLAAGFASTATGAMFIPVSGTTVYTTTAAGSTLVATFPTAADEIFTRVATSTRPPRAGSIFVQTDSRGEARTYFQLGTATSETSQTVTVGAGGSMLITPPNFRFDAGSSAKRPTLSILSGNNQTTDSDGEIEDPLVVVVRQDGKLKPNEQVTFRTSKGTLIGSNQANDAVAEGKRVYGTTDGSGEAEVEYYQDPGSGSDTVTATISGSNYEKEVTFGINGGRTTQQQQQQQQQQTTTNTITISPSSTTGEPGDEVTISVTSDPSGRFVTLSSLDFPNANFSPQSGITPFTSTLLLPSEESAYNFSATSAGLTLAGATVTVEIEEVALGTLAISGETSGRPGEQITVTVTATDADGDLEANVDFTVSGTSILTARGTTAASGIGRAIVGLPGAVGTYPLVARATDYADRPFNVTVSTTGQPQPRAEPESEPAPDVSDPESISIVGPSQRDGTVNTALDAALLVQVVDDGGDAVPDARVIFRVRTGQGQLSARGNGRAIAVQTDEDGYARAIYIPISASSTVEAEARGVTRTVTFTITASGAPATGTRDTDTGTTPGTGTLSPTVLVGTAQRPPMLWVDGGAIYALVGKDVHKFVLDVDNALSIAVGGGKVYWTEKTGESAGTINSANLDGTGVKELKSILAVPMGIAVDVTNSKLYWTNSRGRIQSLNSDGSGRITNVLQNLSSPLDIALAGGNVYWTHSNGGVGFVNLKGQKQVRNISNGADSAGSLAIAGGKVYWTEQVGESGGTINSANLNGSGVTELTSILAVPMGIAVDTARSKLYWTNSRGRIQSADLDGSGIRNVVDGLGNPGDMVLSNSIKAAVEAIPVETTPTTNYDVDGSGSVDNVDVFLVALAVGTSNAKYDVNGDGMVDDKDIALVRDNRNEGAASAPMVVGMKLSAEQIGRLQAQIDLLVASSDRSPAILKTLVYLQQLIATARPAKTQLLANYPNPFNPETWMPYELATDTDVRITIYNTQGVVIRTLELGHQSAGYYTGRDSAAYWDGRNALGEQVASGIYFYQFETDDMSSMRKMVILK